MTSGALPTDLWQRLVDVLHEADRIPSGEQPELIQFADQSCDEDVIEIHYRAAGKNQKAYGRKYDGYWTISHRPVARIAFRDFKPPSWRSVG